MAALRHLLPRCTLSWAGAHAAPVMLPSPRFAFFSGGGRCSLLESSAPPAVHGSAWLDVEGEVPYPHRRARLDPHSQPQESKARKAKLAVRGKQRQQHQESIASSPRKAKPATLGHHMLQRRTCFKIDPKGAQTYVRNTFQNRFNIASTPFKSLQTKVAPFRDGMNIITFPDLHRVKTELILEFPGFRRV